MSERRACSLVAADRKMIRYRSRRPPDTELRAQRAPWMGDTINWGIFKRHFGENYSGINNGRMRDELLNESLFLNLDQARQIIAAWVADYTRRPHSSTRLQDEKPAAYADHLNGNQPSRSAT